MLGKTAAPSTPNNPSVSIRPETGLLISIDPVADLDLNEYSYWVGDTFADARQLARTKSTDYLWETATAGRHRFFIQAHDTSDHINGGSAPVSVSHTIAAPGRPEVALAFEGEQVVLNWQPVTSDFMIAAYEVQQGGHIIAEVTATTFREKINRPGHRDYVIIARDIAGNRSPGAQVSAIITPPAAPNVSVTVIDNTALFRYLSRPGALPVASYEIRKGQSFNVTTPPDIKSGNSNITTIDELEAGRYSYWWSAIDTAGNRSAPTQVMADVTEPPGYILLVDYSARDKGWQGTKTRALTTTAGELLMLVTDEGLTAHYRRHGWQRPQQQLAAGYEYLLQPSTESAQYTEVIDYGTLLPQIILKLSVLAATRDGEVNYTPIITYSPDNQNWTETTESSVLANNVRYVRYGLNVTASGGDDLFLLHDVRLKLEHKLITDTGTARALAADTNGTHVPFNRRFIDVKKIGITPYGRAPISHVVDFDDRPNPEGFKVYLFNNNGERVSARIGWDATGFVL